jgi:hypothetical protein
MPGIPVGHALPQLVLTDDSDQPFAFGSLAGSPALLLIFRGAT